MAKYVSHPISTLDQYLPSGLRPSGWYWSLGLIWGVIQILPCIILYLFNWLHLCRLDNILSLVFFFCFLNLKRWNERTKTNFKRKTNYLVIISQENYIIKIFLKEVFQITNNSSGPRKLWPLPCCNFMHY